MFKKDFVFFLPYKIAIFKKLENELSKISTSSNGGIAIDAASSGFKNKHFFKKFHYIAIDIDIKSLKEGHKKCPEAKAVFADVTKMELSSSFADVAVSTHTFEHIRDEQGRVKFLNQLVQSLKKNGVLLISLNSKDDISNKDIFRTLNSSFENVEIFWFNNLFTRFFEAKFLLSGMFVLIEF